MAHNRHKIAEAMLALIVDHPEGFTFDPRRMCKIAILSDDHVVSLEGRGQRFDHQPTFEDIAAWVDGVSDALDDPQYFLGYWYRNSDQTHHVDVSILVHDEALALAIGVNNGQDCVYSGRTQRTISIKPRRR